MQSTKSSTTFDSRVSAGSAGMIEFMHLLHARGFSVFAVGQETWLPDKLHEEIRFEHADLMARAIRYFPDLAAYRREPLFPWSYWEVKVNTTPGTPNFTIEKACYEEMMARHAKGERVAVAFKDVDREWYANWIDLLDVERDMSDRRQEARGSRTPYLLVRKDRARRLGEFTSRGWPRPAQMPLREEGG